MRSVKDIKTNIIISVIFIAVFTTVAFCEGDVSNLKQYQYWDNGNVRQCDIYDIEGRLQARAFCRNDGTVEKIEKYDEYGKEVEEALYDQNGKLKAGLDGWAAMRWFYRDGRLASQISYTEYGRPIERKQYSESGKLVLRQYVDDDSVPPYEEANMYLLLGGNNVKYYDPTKSSD